jgi:hypothetical protein
MIGRYIISEYSLLAFSLEHENSFQITIFEATKYRATAQIYTPNTFSLTRLVLGETYDENQEPWQAAKV